MEGKEDKSDVFQWAEDFAKTCIEARKYGFSLFRSAVYFSEIHIIKDEYSLKDWIKDRTVGDIDLQRKFRSLNTKVPFIDENDEQFSSFEFSDFIVEGKKSIGLGLSFLKNSLSISFGTSPIWQKTEIELSYEFIDKPTDEITEKIVIAKNISSPKHLNLHKDFILEKLKAQAVPENWNPYLDYLPSKEISNNLMNVTEFYQNIRQKSRGEQNAEIWLMGTQIAELNHYQFTKKVSGLNKSDNKLRVIFQSLNSKGAKLFLSIDFEKGAFEVCDGSGNHIEEILFDGNSNSGAKSDHSIKI